MPKPIYTRKGDKGKTGLFSGERIEKTNPRVETYGTVDELNASLGLAKTFSSQFLRPYILNIQKKIFFIASELATIDHSKAIKKVLPEDIIELEQKMDFLSEKLPEAKNFVIPGGTKSAAFLHFARTICRRAERNAVRLSHKESINPELLKYLNRLSDYLFVLSCYANIIEGEGDLIISREGTSIQKKNI